jgi:radical SAM superfamily enzyme YgiQ (UPF0313 family)
MTRSAADILFVHTPKFSSEYLPLGEYLNITYTPMGLFALAELTRRLGRRAEIVHLGIEWKLDPDYRIEDELRERRPRAVGLSLHWHYQSYDALQVAAAIKRASPDTFVFLGGFTASLFAEEIVRDFDAVDAVVLGPGEGALPTLLDQLDVEDPDLASVPSLVYRDGGQPRRTVERYQDSQEAYDALVFGEIPLLRHHEEYVRWFGFPLAFPKEYRPDEHRAHQTMGRTFFPLNVGRGCPVACTYCGGNREALATINGRNRVMWRDPERVLDDMRRALDAGYRTMAVCFDPTPSRDDYFVDLFARVRRARLPVDLYFESWALPTPGFVEAFARTFSTEHSYLAVSPDSGDEEVRRWNKGFHYTNDDLRAFLRGVREHGVSADVFFSIALPGETLARALRTRDLITEIREGCDSVRRLMTWSVQLEPGSPQFLRPADFGMVTDRTCFRDFYRGHGGPNADTYSSLGFKIEAYFGDSRDRGSIQDFEAHVQHLKCMEFCFLSADPRQRVSPEEGRRHCLARRQTLAARRGVSRPQEIIGDAHRYADAARALREGLPARPRPEIVG